MSKRSGRRASNKKNAPTGAAESDEASAKKRTRKSNRKDQEGNAAVEWAKSLGVAFLLFIFLRTFIVQTFVITSGSMEETLLVGDMLLVNRLAIGSSIPFTPLRIPGYSEARHGDILVFDPHHEPDLKLVKRLIGVPGDTLEMRGRVLWRNGVAVTEPYVILTDERDVADPRMAWQRDVLLPGVDPGTYAPTRDTWGPIVIPEDRYFMMGDNRDNSLDSRFWGLLEGWRLEGRAVFTYYSYNKDSYKPFPWVREVRWGRIGRGID